MFTLLEGLTAALALLVASALWSAHFSPLARQKIPGPWHAGYTRAWLFGKVLGCAAALRSAR